MWDKIQLNKKTTKIKTKYNKRHNYSRLLKPHEYYASSSSLINAPRFVAGWPLHIISTKSIHVRIRFISISSLARMTEKDAFHLHIRSQKICPPSLLWTITWNLIWRKNYYTISSKSLKAYPSWTIHFNFKLWGLSQMILANSPWNLSSRKFFSEL